VRFNPDEYITGGDGRRARWQKTFAERFWARVRRGAPDKCWLWTGATFGKKGEGYGVLRLCGRDVHAHRVAYFLLHGALPEGMGCHTCDTPLCVNPAHVFPGTAADNSADMVAKGRQAHGERHPAAKLTRRQAEEIRQRYAAGVVTQATLGTEYNVHQVQVWRVIHRENWS
jgi:hypothetical protein